MRIPLLPAISVPLLAAVFPTTLARADEEADAKKAVESFLSAVQAGDEKSMQAVITSAPEQEPAVNGYLDLMAATSNLQKAAIAKFGPTAAATFGAATEAQLNARLKALKDAPIKLTGNSALLAMPADETTKQSGGTIVLVKSGPSWKIDGASLFHLTPDNQKDTEKNVAVAARLLAVTKQMIQEINAGKYAAAVDAYQEFWSRSVKAAKESPTTSASQPAK